MSKETISVHFISTKPLPEKLLEEFQMPGNPYKFESAYERAEGMFKELGIVFFRDEENSAAIIIEPDDDDPTPILERRGWEGYRHSGVLERKNGKISTLKANPVDKRRILKARGHLKNWHRFNVAFLVDKLTDRSFSGEELDAPGQSQNYSEIAQK